MWPLGLLLEQTGGSAIDSLTKFRNAMHALERPSEDAVMRACCASPRRRASSCGGPWTQGHVTMDSVDAMPTLMYRCPWRRSRSSSVRSRRSGYRAAAALRRRMCEQRRGSRRRQCHSHPGRHRRRVALAGSFARRYMADARGQEQPLTSFQFASAAVTFNVALSYADAVSGGRRLGDFCGAVQCIERQAGDASVHSSSLLHGVSRMRGGTRYSLICFFGFVA